MDVDGYDMFHEITIITNIMTIIIYSSTISPAIFIWVRGDRSCYLWGHRLMWVVDIQLDHILADYVAYE